jgi:hypothetical protein
VVAAEAVAVLAGVAALIAARRKRAATGAVARTGTGMAPGLVPGHLFWTSGGGMINQANLDGSNQQAIVSGKDGPAWWRSMPATSTGPTTPTAPSTGPTWTAPARTPSSAARTPRYGVAVGL